MDRSSAAIVDVTAVMISICREAGGGKAKRGPFANVVFADPASARAFGRAVERATAPITDGSTVVADTGRVVATGEWHAGIKAAFRVWSAVAIRRRIRRCIRRSRINDFRIGKARVRPRSYPRLASSSFELNHACVGTSPVLVGSLSMLVTVSVASRSAEVHSAVAHVGGDRIRKPKRRRPGRKRPSAHVCCTQEGRPAAPLPGSSRMWTLAGLSTSTSVLPSCRFRAPFQNLRRPSQAAPSSLSRPALRRANLPPLHHGRLCS
jgi:hypothetical protein